MSYLKGKKSRIEKKNLKRLRHMLKNCAPMVTIKEELICGGMSCKSICNALNLTRKEFVWYSKGLLNLDATLIDAISRISPFSKRFMENLSKSWEVIKKRLLKY